MRSRVHYARLLSLRCALLAFSLPLACGDSPSVNVLTAEFVPPDSPVDLGSVYVGFPESFEIELQTRGALPLNFQIQTFGDTGIFTVTPQLGMIPTNGTTLITVTVNANRLGEFELLLNVFTNANTGVTNGSVRILADGRLPPDCEDGNGCTIDRFDPQIQSCVFEQHEGQCDDRNRCTENDLCRNGVCIGEPVVCDDEDVCTDNLCNPSLGCLFPQTRSCNDNNPCTTDTCLSPEGCKNEDVENGTLCDDIEACTEADVCLNGQCIGIAIPDGATCDDGDPCSKDESCQDGICVDESYTAPGIRDVKYDTFVGPLADDAGRNPIIDAEGNTYFGTKLGVVAVDSCGELLWRNDQFSEPSWRVATSLPGSLFVPIDTTIISLDAVTGAEITRTDLRAITSSTSSTAEVSIKEMIVRSNGHLLISVKEWEPQALKLTGYLLELEPNTSTATILYELPSGWIAPMALDQTEMLTAVMTLTSTIYASGREHHLVEYDLLRDNITWSTSSTYAHSMTYFARGAEDEIYWSNGKLYNTGAQTSDTVIDSSQIKHELENGGPSVGIDRVYWAINHSSEQSLPGQLPASAQVVATSTTGEPRWTRNLNGLVQGAQGAISRFGDVFIMTNQGELYGFDKDGNEVLNYSVTNNGNSPYVSNPTLSTKGVLIFGFQERIVGIQMSSGLSRSPWPRYRHDNLSTGHQ